jgi:hypothetical protein
MEQLDTLTIRSSAPATAYPAPRRSWRRAVWPAVVILAGAMLFAAYLLQSAHGAAVTSDSASNAMQAWAMLHGDVLLRGWALADVSFYTVDLPEYVIVEAFRGFNPEVVHICGALTYTALVLLAGALAVGRQGTGRTEPRTGPMAAAVAAACMLAPQLGIGTRTLLLSPDHVGTGVPLLALWLVIERTGYPDYLRQASRARWLVPAVAGMVLAWVAVGDMLAEVIGALPLVLVCLFRVARMRGRGGRLELSLAAAAVLSVPAAMLATRLITALGGWTASPPRTTLVGPDAWPHHVYLAGMGILQLFGADFLHQATVAGTVVALVHLTGLALAAAGLWLAVARFSQQDLIVQVLALAIVINIAAYIFTAQAHDINDTREIAPVLAFGAVLAGRLFASRLLAPRRDGYGVARWRRLPGTAIVVAVLLAAYAATLGYDVSRPPVASSPADLAAWLAGHHLTKGLGGYWQSNAVTLDSRGAVQVRAIDVNEGRLMAGGYWDADNAWYDPATQYANFVVSVPPPWHPKNPGSLIRAMEAVAGRPARIYFHDGLAIAVWQQNLLARLG